MCASSGKPENSGATLLDELSTAENAAGSLPERLVEAREAVGLSAAQLARRIGVKSSTLHAWEAGRSGPRPNVLLRLAGMLNVSPTWLLTGTGDSPEPPLPDTEMAHIRASVKRLRGILIEVAEELARLEERMDSYEAFRNEKSAGA